MNLYHMRIPLKTWVKKEIRKSGAKVILREGNSPDYWLRSSNFYSDKAHNGKLWMTDCVVGVEAVSY